MYEYEVNVSYNGHHYFRAMLGSISKEEAEKRFQHIIKSLQFYTNGTALLELHPQYGKRVSQWSNEGWAAELTAVNIQRIRITET